MALSSQSYPNLAKLPWISGHSCPIQASAYSVSLGMWSQLDEQAALDPENIEKTFLYMIINIPNVCVPYKQVKKYQVFPFFYVKNFSHLLHVLSVNW